MPAFIQTTAPHGTSVAAAPRSPTSLNLLLSHPNPPKAGAAIARPRRPDNCEFEVRSENEKPAGNQKLPPGTDRSHPHLTSHFTLVPEPVARYVLQSSLMSYTHDATGGLQMVVEGGNCAHKYANDTAAKIEGRSSAQPVKIDFVPQDKDQTNPSIPLGERPAPPAPASIAQAGGLTVPERATLNYFHSDCPQYGWARALAIGCYVLSGLCVSVLVFCVRHLFGERPRIQDPNLTAVINRAQTQIMLLAVTGCLVTAFVWACLGAFLAMLREMAMNLWHLRRAEFRSHPA